MTLKMPANHHYPNTQEPRITGNSGNSGNGLTHRGFQPLPPYKKSGNNWQRTPDFHYKSASLPRVLGITVASGFAVGNGYQRWKPCNTWLLPLLPLLPVFLKSVEHWITSDSAEVKL